jgi:hypothetical protein
MKVIVSHDIDHLSAFEHAGDGILVKSLVRSHLELAAGKITLAELGFRFAEVFANRLHHLDELMDFDEAQGVPATFFIGIRQGRGLSYPAAQARRWAEKIGQRAFPVYLHANAGPSLGQRCQEVEDFATMTGRETIGIRTHYLADVDAFLAREGPCNRRIKFDSSKMLHRDVFPVNKIWRFPVHLMDSTLMENGRRWQTRSLAEAQTESRRVVDSALAADFRFFVVNFHDRYFSKAFASWMAWYQWLIGDLRRRGLTFVSFDQAVAELEAPS